MTTIDGAHAIAAKLVAKYGFPVLLYTLANVAGQKSDLSRDADEKRAYRDLAGDLREIGSHASVDTRPYKSRMR